MRGEERHSITTSTGATVGVSHTTTGATAMGPGPRSKCDQVVYEAIAKAAEVIVRSRATCERDLVGADSSSAAAGITARRGSGGGASSSRFNFEIGEVPSVRQQLQPWRRSLHVPLRLDVYYRGAADGGGRAVQGDKGGDDGTDDGRVLLERWCMDYVPPSFPHEASEEAVLDNAEMLVQLRHVCKRVIINLRTIHCHARLLPAYALYCDMMGIVRNFSGRDGRLFNSALLPDGHSNKAHQEGTGAIGFAFYAAAHSNNNPIGNTAGNKSALYGDSDDAFMISNQFLWHTFPSISNPYGCLNIGVWYHPNSADVTKLLQVEQRNMGSLPAVFPGQQCFATNAIGHGSNGERNRDVTKSAEIEVGHAKKHPQNCDVLDGVQRSKSAMSGLSLALLSVQDNNAINSSNRTGTDYPNKNHQDQPKAVQEQYHHHQRHQSNIEYGMERRRASPYSSVFNPPSPHHRHYSATSAAINQYDNQSQIAYDTNTMKQYPVKRTYSAEEHHGVHNDHGSFHPASYQEQGTIMYMRGSDNQNARYNASLSRDVTKNMSLTGTATGEGDHRNGSRPIAMPAAKPPHSPKSYKDNMIRKSMPPNEHQQQAYSAAEHSYLHNHHHHRHHHPEHQHQEHQGYGYGYNNTLAVPLQPRREGDGEQGQESAMEMMTEQQQGRSHNVYSHHHHHLFPQHQRSPSLSSSPRYSSSSPMRQRLSSSPSPFCPSPLTAGMYAASPSLGTNGERRSSRKGNTLPSTNAVTSTLSTTSSSQHPVGSAAAAAAAKAEISDGNAQPRPASPPFKSHPLSLVGGLNNVKRSGGVSVALQQSPQQQQHHHQGFIGDSKDRSSSTATSMLLPPDTLETLSASPFKAAPGGVGSGSSATGGGRGGKRGTSFPLEEYSSLSSSVLTPYIPLVPGGLGDDPHNQRNLSNVSSLVMGSGVSGGGGSAGLFMGAGGGLGRTSGSTMGAGSTLDSRMNGSTVMGLDHRHHSNMSSSSPYYAEEMPFADDEILSQPWTTSTVSARHVRRDKGGAGGENDDDDGNGDTSDELLASSTAAASSFAHRCATASRLSLFNNGSISNGGDDVRSVEDHNDSDMSRFSSNSTALAGQAEYGVDATVSVSNLDDQLAEFRRFGAALTVDD